MPQAIANKPYFGISRGLNTEASPLTYPEGFSVDENNFDIDISGRRFRRLGLDYEAGSVVCDSIGTSADVGFNYFIWNNALGSDTENWLIIKEGRYLEFYDLDAVSISASNFLSIDLSLYKTAFATTALVDDSYVSMASSSDVLFVTGQSQIPTGFRFTSRTVYTTVSSFPTHRDFTDIEDGVGVATNPTAMTSDHLYNLFNRGWTTTNINQYYTDTGTYPSKAQIQVFGKRTNVTTGVDEFNSTELNNSVFSETSAPKGSFIRNSLALVGIFSRILAITHNINTWSYDHPTTTVTINTTAPHSLTVGASVTITGNDYTFDNGPGCGSAVAGSLDGIHTVVTTPSSTSFTISVTIPSFVAWCTQYVNKGAFTFNKSPSFITNLTSQGPRCNAFYSGRTWYAGSYGGSIDSWVFFSQIPQGDDLQYFRCYQEADPTSEYISDLIDTDGGVINIQGLGKVLCMKPIYNSLLIYTTRGVWEVAGVDGGVFKPTAYSVTKIAEIGITSPSGVAEVEGSHICWAREGIYVIKPSDNTGTLGATNISSERIESYYNGLTNAERDTVTASYDNKNKRLYWLHGNTKEKNRVLVYDIKRDAFIKYSFPITPGWIRGIYFNDRQNLLKFYVSKNSAGSQLTFADLNNTSFLDWGVTDAAAYIVTGYELLGDAMRRKQAPYVYCYFDRTETAFTATGFDKPSGCLMQARWDWSDHSNSGKFAEQVQVYRFNRMYSGVSGDPFNNGYPVVMTRNRVRGSGKSLHIRFDTEAGKDCKLLGYSVNYKGSTVPSGHN